MINEERVKKIYKIALYDQTEEKEHRQVGHFYRSDYIIKEILKSFFTGSIAFGLIVVLWIMSNWSEFMRQVNTLEIIDTGVAVLIWYGIFMIIYLVATGIVYSIRYKHSKQRLDEYLKDMKRVYQMYEREEKLKL